MSYVVVPIYREGANIRYTAPVVFLDDKNDINTLSLFRFDKWSFHLTTVSYVKRNGLKRLGEFWKKDPNSNRSKRRANRKFEGSRCERRSEKRFKHSGNSIKGANKYH